MNHEPHWQEMFATAFSKAKMQVMTKRRLLRIGSMVADIKHVIAATKCAAGADLSVCVMLDTGASIYCSVTGGTHESRHQCCDNIIADIHAMMKEHLEPTL